MRKPRARGTSTGPFKADRGWQGRHHWFRRSNALIAGSFRINSAAEITDAGRGCATWQEHSFRGNVVRL